MDEIRDQKQEVRARQEIEAMFGDVAPAQSTYAYVLTDRGPVVHRLFRANGEDADGMARVGGAPTPQLAADGLIRAIKKAFPKRLRGKLIWRIYPEIYQMKDQWAAYARLCSVPFDAQVLDYSPRIAMDKIVILPDNKAVVPDVPDALFINERELADLGSAILAATLSVTDKDELRVYVRGNMARIIQIAKRAVEDALDGYKINVRPSDPSPTGVLEVGRP